MRFNFSRKNIITMVAGGIAGIALAVGIVLVIINNINGKIDEDSYLSVNNRIAESQIVSSKPEEQGLIITSPSSLNSTVTVSKTVITGIADKEFPVLMNGSEIEKSQDGSFSVEVDLKVGENLFKFEHKGVTTLCKINYRYVIISSYSPKNQSKYSSGSTFVVTATARVGSTVTANFNGTTITLTKQKHNENDEFADFKGSFKLPDKNDADLNMGRIKFVGTFNGITESFYSGKIICQKNTYLASRPYVAEIVAFTAETFNGATVDDYSDPRNNYLPKGTVDYCDSGLVYDPASGYNFVKLRCGRRVYLDKPTDDKKDRVTITSRYRGELPDHNELAVASFNQTGRHTVITLDTMWKAPFLLDIYPQKYANVSTQNFAISSATYEYVEIDFCYATKFDGCIEIPKSNSIFKKAEIIKGNNKFTLRLYLKEKGKFYGWDCSYNSNGQLCFEFLNPYNSKTADNEYNIDLSGAKILIDAGHGGFDPGACRGNTEEQERNLNLAKKIKAELEKTGAKVVMTRTGDYTVTADERRQILKREKPDYCIAIHHNSATVKSAHGFEAYHFTPFSMKAANDVLKSTMSTKLYDKSKFGSHYFFLSRITTCPVVLTESGYFTNDNDYNNILSESANLKKAKAIVNGIANYFIGIRYTPVEDPEPKPEPLPSQPEVSAPEVSEPEVSEPEVTEPETSEPETSEPETSQPEVSEPVASLPPESSNEESSTE